MIWCGSKFPIPIGNNRFYRKWFEEPSTRSIFTRHSENAKCKLIDLPFFHFSCMLFLSVSFRSVPFGSSSPIHKLVLLASTLCNVIELLQIDRETCCRCKHRHSDAHTHTPKTETTHPSVLRFQRKVSFSCAAKHSLEFFLKKKRTKSIGSIALPKIVKYSVEIKLRNYY